MNRLLLIALFLGLPLYGEQQQVSGLDDMLEASEKAVDNYLDRFKSFVRDNNIMGQATLPDGTPVEDPKAENADDRVNFQHPLTYHDNAYRTSIENPNFKEDKSKPNDGETKDNQKELDIPRWVSDHAFISAAGGSSRLERKSGELDKKFKKDAEKQNEEIRKSDEEDGEFYFSFFKETAQQVEKQDQSGNDPNEPPEKIKIFRTEIREEAKPEIVQIGEDSAGLAIEKARDKGKEKDDTALANSTFLYENAGRDTKALWDSTLANRGQLIINDAVDAAPVQEAKQLNEGSPSCESGYDKALAKLEEQAQESGASKVSDADMQELDNFKRQCEETTKVAYNEIAPEWVEKKGGKQGNSQVYELKPQGVDEEDGDQRDLRVQLEVMAKAGKDPNDVETNWQYEEKDRTARITLSFDENGDPDRVEELTVADQLDLYNQELQKAAEGYAQVKELLPDLETDPNAPLQYQIAPESKSIMEINGATSSQLSEFGITGTREESIPTSYKQLIEAGQEE